MESEAQVVGREEEVAALADFLDAQAHLPAGLLLEGDAGIGKTTLWRRGAALAAERGYRVLSCRGSSSEAQLSFVALGDLVGDALQDVLPALPRPQARALGVALLLEDTDGSPPDQRAIALGFAGALRVLARSQPVAVAIDDLQWLDRPSAFVLEFTLRRLREDGIAFLLTLRNDEEHARPVRPRPRAGRGAAAAATDRPAQPRRAPPPPERPARSRPVTTQAAADPRAVGREPDVRARAGTRRDPGGHPVGAGRAAARHTRVGRAGPADGAPARHPGRVARGVGGLASHPRVGRARRRRRGRRPARAGL